MPRLSSRVRHCAPLCRATLCRAVRPQGSTCAMVEAMLRSCGYRTGLYTSPHLVDVRERIRIDGWVDTVGGWAGGMRQGGPQEDGGWEDRSWELQRVRNWEMGAGSRGLGAEDWEEDLWSHVREQVGGIVFGSTHAHRDGPPIPCYPML